ncbi:transposase [Streptomyces sp. NPDC047976]|uniref:transposase n=1 Tax=Streptomyces sp. NPDC047976 TaxID=3155746 RepID=UPI003425F73C
MGAARYSGEFKRDAVALVESSGRSVPSVARELGVNPESLRQWGARSQAEAAVPGGTVSASGFYRWINAAATRVARRVADEDLGV